jgi:hypothetical protein
MLPSQALVIRAPVVPPGSARHRTKLTVINTSENP